MTTPGCGAWRSTTIAELNRGGYYQRNPLCGAPATTVLVLDLVEFPELAGDSIGDGVPLYRCDLHRIDLSSLTPEPVDS